jgi:hypothetical protein
MICKKKLKKKEKPTLFFAEDWGEGVFTRHGLH